MDWKQMERRLERGFRARPRRSGSTIVIERRRPLKLAAIMNEALSEDEQDEWGDLEAWPGSLSELLEQHGIEERRLLYFYWDGVGPTSWVAGLVLIGNGRRRYLSYWNELESYLTVAAIEPWHDPIALSETVRRLLGRNGKGFGVTPFGSLPTETTNRAPELIAKPVVRQAYFDLLQWREREQGAAWITLADEHYGRIAEPNHLERSLDLLKTLPRLDEPKAISAWLAERDAESAALPDQARQRLFDDWFAGAYDEEPIARRTVNRAVS
jgi:hypothetical protein